MTKCRKFIGLVLVAVYALFFASTHFFYHSHQFADFKLVHSHPFNNAGHSHTANQIALFSLLDSESYQDSSIADAPAFVPVQIGEKICGHYSGQFVSTLLQSVSLRAPPAFSQNS